MNYTIILALMGGLGLFLYGMKLMSDGLEKAARCEASPDS